MALRNPFAYRGFGILKWLRNDIDKSWPIVFDGEYVFYGVADVREALQQYKKWQEKRYQ